MSERPTSGISRRGLLGATAGGAALAGALSAHIPGSGFDMPGGGIYAWLPTGGLSGDEEARALEEGVSVSSGRMFHISGEDPFAVRLSISSVAALRMNEIVRRLHSAWR